jgi:hypothetical protein
MTSALRIVVGSILNWLWVMIHLLGQKIWPNPGLERGIRKEIGLKK